MPVKRRIIISIAITIFILIASYWTKNTRIPFNTNEGFVLKNYEYIRERIITSNNKSKWYDSIILINTSYDIETIPYKGDREFEQGVLPITNRKALYTFLREASHYDYKYILLDIEIDDIETPYNDSIKSILPQLKNICIPRSRDFAYTDATLDSLSGWVDYYATPSEQGFVKYLLYESEKESLPLKMYQDIYGRRIKRILGGMAYFDGINLCQRTIYPSYKIMPPYDISADKKSTPKTISDYKNLTYQNLTSDILEGNTINSIENKYVIIGDYFIHDKHDTYIGNIPGAIINLNAFISLSEKKHYVNWIIVFVLSIIYFTTSYLILTNFNYKKDNQIKPVNNFSKLQNILNYPLIRFCVSFLSLGLLFVTISLFLYILGYYYSAWLPSLVFTVFSHIIFTKRKENEYKKSNCGN